MSDILSACLIGRCRMALLCDARIFRASMIYRCQAGRAIRLYADDQRSLRRNARKQVDNQYSYNSVSSSHCTCPSRTVPSNAAHSIEIEYAHVKRQSSIRNAATRGSFFLCRDRASPKGRYIRPAHNRHFEQVSNRYPERTRMQEYQQRFRLNSHKIGKKC